MATKLFLRNTAANGIGTFFDMLATAGAGSATGVVNSAASGTQIQWTRTAGGTVLEYISGRVPAGGFTLSGTMTFSIWAHESNAQANCGARARVFKRAANGTVTEIAGGPWNDGVEFGTSAAEMTWTGTPTSTAFAEDDRLIVRFYITNIGTMGGSRTCTLTYNAADAATGDSFFQINENVTFKAESAACAPVDEFQAQTIDAAAITPAVATAANDAFQGQSIDQPSITPKFVVSVNDCGQAQASDASAITAYATATPADASQAQTEDQPSIAPAVATAAADAMQDQSIDAPGVTYSALASPDDAGQAMSLDSPLLAAAVATAANDAAQGQTTDQPSIAVMAAATPVDAHQGQSADAPSISATAAAIASDAAQGQFIDDAAAGPAAPATAADIGQDMAIDGAAVTAQALATPDDVAQGQDAESPAASGSGNAAAEPDDVLQGQLMDSPAMVARSIAIADDLFQAQSASQAITPPYFPCPPTRCIYPYRPRRTAFGGRRPSRRVAPNLQPRRAGG